MADIFSKITEFFTSLLNSDPEETRKRKALKQIYDDLKQIHPPLYKHGSNEILPALGTALFNLYNLLYPINEIMTKTVLNENRKTAEHFKQYLIEENLPGDLTNLRLMISYDEIKDRLTRSAAPTREIKYIYDSFREEMNRISKQDEQIVTMEITQFMRLSELCRLDYYTALKRMDPQINLNNPKYRPNFKSIDGKAVLGTLMDIYYVLSPLSFENGIENNLHLLIEKLTAEGIKEKQKAITKNLTLIKRLIQKQLAPVNLGNLICAIKKDPFFKPPIDTEVPQDLVSQYRDQLEKNFQKNRDKAERELNEGVIGTNLKGLFPDGKLDALKAYNEENARLIERETQGELIHHRPLAILKTFVLRKFNKEIQPPLNKIILEGFFENKEFQHSINEAYYACQESLPRISTFEVGLEEKRGASITTVITYIEGIKKGKDLSASLTQVLDNINKRAAEVLEEETNHFYQLGNHILALIEDYKSRSPEKISNIKTIGGTGNRELISQIVHGYNDLAKFIKVMRNFTMIHTGSAPAAPPEE